MTQRDKESIVIVIFVSLVILGCVLLPALTIMRFSLGFGWEIGALLSIACLIFSLRIIKNVEKKKKSKAIREKVQSCKKWMSLADFGVSYGRIEKRGRKGKEVNQEVDRWSYLRKILDETSNSKNENRSFKMHSKSK